MRHLTEEELKILQELEDPNLSEDEREKKIKRLKEIDIEVNNGLTWLT